MEGNELRVNMGKTKVLTSGLRFDVLQKSAQTQFSVVVVPVGATTNAVVSLAVQNLIPGTVVNGELERPDQLMAGK